MKHKINLKSLYVSLFIIIICTTVASASIILFKLTTKNSIENVKQEDEWLVSQLCEIVDYVTQQAESISSLLAFDNEIQSLLIQHQYTEKEKPSISEVQTKINNTLVDKANFNKSIYDCKNIILFSNDGKILGSKESIDMSTTLDSYSWAEQVINSKGRGIWLPLSYDKNSKSTQNSLSLPLVRKIFSTQASSSNTLEEMLSIGKPLGYVLIYFDDYLFSEFISKDTTTAKKLFLVDSNNIIISSQNKQNVGSTFTTTLQANGFTLFDEEEYLLTEKELSRQGWRYICLTARNEVVKTGKFFLVSCILIMIILSTTFIILGILLSNITTKPIHNLIKHFKKAESGKTLIEDQSSIVEFDDLYNSFNDTMNKIHELGSEIYQAKLEKQELAISIKESKIQALQNQINPHFLYNTLDCINWKALMDGNTEVSEMICTLGKFFRSNIRLSENEIPLSQEIENVELYVKLSSYIYPKKLKFTSKILIENPEKVAILRLLLQPIIENSVKHGIEATGEEINVNLEIISSTDKINITISDDGPGLDSDTLSYLRSLWDVAGQEYHKETRSIGLYNVFRRLRLTYQNEAEVLINSESNKGATFIIIIPMKFLEEN